MPNITNKFNASTISSNTPEYSFLNTLTKKLEYCNNSNDLKTHAEYYSILWDCIRVIRNTIRYNPSFYLLSGWKYKDSFELTEHYHKNDKQIFKDISWEESYCLSLTYFVFIKFY